MSLWCWGKAQGIKSNFFSYLKQLAAYLLFEIDGCSTLEKIACGTAQGTGTRGLLSFFTHGHALLNHLPCNMTLSVKMRVYLYDFIESITNNQSDPHFFACHLFVVALLMFRIPLLFERTRFYIN